MDKRPGVTGESSLQPYLRRWRRSLSPGAWVIDSERPPGLRGMAEPRGASGLNAMRLWASLCFRD